mmetsp:Transcript_1865/g.3426  ORF Transcript_1865/g.3426 Transcript_1865/m.3426 type:complete len:249 (+) Transcript_1865:310-1056(+)
MNAAWVPRRSSFSRASKVFSTSTSPFGPATSVVRRGQLGSKALRTWSNGAGQRLKSTVLKSKQRRSGLRSPTRVSASRSVWRLAIPNSPSTNLKGVRLQLSTCSSPHGRKLAKPTAFVACRFKNWRRGQLPSGSNSTTGQLAKSRCSSCAKCAKAAKSITHVWLKFKCLRDEPQCCNGLASQTLVPLTFSAVSEFAALVVRSASRMETRRAAAAVAAALLAERGEVSLFLLGACFLRPFFSPRRRCWL